MSARREDLLRLRADAWEALEFMRDLRMAWEMGTDPHCIEQQMLQQAKESARRAVEVNRLAGCGDPAVAQILALDAEASTERLRLLGDMHMHGMKARPAPTLDDIGRRALQAVEEGQAERYRMLEDGIRQMEREGNHEGAASVRKHMDRIKTVAARITRPSPTPARSTQSPVKPKVPEEVRELGALFSMAVGAS